MGKTSAERKKLATRASRIRARIAAGKRVSPDDKALLERWNAEKNPNGRPSTLAPDDGAKAEPARSAPKAEPAKSAPKAGAESESDEPIGAPPPPPPPPVLGRVSPPSSSKRGDWRDAYRAHAAGRESTCVQLATLWGQQLKAMIAQIRELDPERTLLFDESAVDGYLKPNMILTVDRVLPPHFELGAEVMSAAGTTSIITQRWLAARAHAKRHEKEQELARRAGSYAGRVKQAEPETKESNNERPEDAPRRAPATPFVPDDDAPY